MTETKRIELVAPVPAARDIPRSEIDGFLEAAPMMLSMALPGGAPDALLGQVAHLATNAREIQLVINGVCVVNLRIV